jgi:hypothetical protein
MPKQIEDELKVDNWLSILTYDAAKYAAAGGAIVPTLNADGLILQLPGVTLEHLHSKLRRLLDSDGTIIEPAPPAAD